MLCISGCAACWQRASYFFVLMVGQKAMDVVGSTGLHAGVVCVCSSCDLVDAPAAALSHIGAVGWSLLSYAVLRGGTVSC